MTSTPLHTARQRSSRVASGAVGYLRRSTDRQEQSISDQREAVENYCRDHGLELLRFYIDDAVSGVHTAGRRGFQQLISDAQQKRCDFRFVVVYDVKRFGRVDNDEAGYYRYLLREQGVKVLYAAENFADDGTDDLLRPVKQWQAREESKDLAKVSIRGLLSKSTTGCWMGGAPPFGYDLRYESPSGAFLLRLRYNRNGSKQILDDAGSPVRDLPRGESLVLARCDRARLVPGAANRVEAVRRIFAMYIERGLGLARIAGVLNGEGVASARDSSWAPQYSGRWSTTTVAGVLTHPAYCGDMVWNRRTDARFYRIDQGRTVERMQYHARRLEPNDRRAWIVSKDTHPAIVTRRTWELAQQKIAANRGPSCDERWHPHPLVPFPAATMPCDTVGSGPRARFLLSGLCGCGRCGHRYEGLAGRGRRASASGRSQYICGGYLRGGPGVCCKAPIDQRALERCILDLVTGFYDEHYLGGATDLRAAAANAAARCASELAERRSVLRRYLGTIEEQLQPTARRRAPRPTLRVDTSSADVETHQYRARRELESLSHLAPTSSEVEALIAEVASFLSGLRSVLESGARGQRREALRRCLRRVVVDGATCMVRAEMVLFPTADALNASSEIAVIERRVEPR